MTRDIWNIEQEFEKMRGQMNQLMNSFFTDSFDRDVPLIGSSEKEITNLNFKKPAIDMYEKDDEIVAKIEVPGVNKEDIKLEIKNNILSIRAEKKLEKENKDEKKGYYRIERSYSGFARSFPLPKNVDEENVKANYKNGVLIAHIPKKKEIEEEKTKYIEIE